MAKISPIQIQKYLKGIDYPADKETILEAAGRNDAPEDVRAMLEQLPDEEFDAPTALNAALKPLNEGEQGSTATEGKAAGHEDKATQPRATDKGNGEEKGSKQSR